MYYILDEYNQVVPTSIEEYGEFMQSERKVVCQEDVVGIGANFRVSTVFLGLDHGFGLNSAPIVFETIVFGGQHEPCARYTTYDEAIDGHEKLVNKLVNGWHPDDETISNN